MEVPLLKEMINFALLGAGRIGKMHAQNILQNPKCNLVYVYDINNDFANLCDNRVNKLLKLYQLKVLFIIYLQN